jgi:hypothetical protein
MINISLYCKAIRNLTNLDFYLLGNKIVWLDESQSKPTEAEINAEVARLQAEYEAKEYQRQRAVAYPSIQDQLDTLYHGGYDAWKATITAVKEEFPKP